MFHWEPEGCYHHRLCTVIATFWFSTEHLWIVIVPLWLATDAICPVLCHCWAMAASCSLQSLVKLYICGLLLTICDAGGLFFLFFLPPLLLLHLGLTLLYRLHPLLVLRGDLLAPLLVSEPFQLLAELVTVGRLTHTEIMWHKNMWSCGYIL